MAWQAHGGQAFRFAISGVLNTLIHFIVLSVFFELIGLGIVWSTTYAFIAAAAFSYAINYSFTFKSDQSHKHSLPKFAVTILLGLAWNISLMHLSVNVWGGDYRLAFPIVVMVVMVNNFLLSKFWVYKA